MGATTRMRITRRFFTAVLGVGLLSLVFLGSPGCGCGDDDLRPPGDERPERCCCDFEWLPPTAAIDRDVVVLIENADASLDATVTPGLFATVSPRTPEQFTVCVNQEHLLGDSLEIAFYDEDTNVPYGRAALIYSQRCRPEIEPLSSDLNLVSTDCGGGTLQCCCEFEWLPGSNMAGDVAITAENVSAGLNPVITPSAITGVVPGAIELLDVCVDTDHPIGAQMDLVVRQQGSGALMGSVTLVYDEQCVPTVLPTTKANALDITSTECGGEPLTCCCEFDWLPGPNDSGDVNLTVANASPGLTVQITPSTLTGVSPRVFQSFTVCINADHNLLDAFDLVISSTAGPELGRARIVYRLRCEPDIGDVPGAASLVLTSTDCGGDPLQCCCDIQWQSPTSPSFAQIDATLENVDPSLEVATVTPAQVLNLPAGDFQIFTVCVNPAHDIDATLDLVLRSPTGLEIARLPLEYTAVCLPQPGDPSGEGFWSVLCLGPDSAKAGR